MNKPDVSILMAAYNAERYLAEAVASVLAQEGVSLELIVVDDGSTDRTAGILDDLARQDPRLRVIHRANQGCLSARNAACEQARGRYLMLMDADDRIRAGKLAKQAAFLDRHPDYSAIYCDTWFIDPHGAELAKQSSYGMRPQPSGDIFEFIISRCWMTIHSVLVRRQCFERCGLHDLSCPCVMGDWELWARLAAEYRFFYQDEALADYRIHPDMSQAPENRVLIRKMMRNTFARIAALPRFQTIAPRARARYYLQQGKFLLEAGERRPARRALWRAIQAAPDQGSAWVALAFTFLGRRTFHRWMRAYRRLRARVNKDKKLVRDPPWAIGV